MRCFVFLGIVCTVLYLYQFSSAGLSSKLDTALLVKIIQKPVSVFFSSSLASNCSFITREREREGGRLETVNAAKLILC